MLELIPYYNRQKNQFIAAMITHDDPVVRAAAASDNHCPTKQLQAAILIETDPTVLKALLYNLNLPVKSITGFANNEARSTVFDDDEELTAHLVERIG